MDIVRQQPARARRVLLPAALGVVLVGAVLARTAHRSAASAGPVVEHGSLVTARVERGVFVRQVPAQGTLVPEHVQWLSAVSAARVAKIHVRPGALVEPDTIVLTLENAELELAALQAEQQAATARAALIQSDVSTSALEEQQESSLAAYRSDLRDAQRHSAAAAQLAPMGLISDLDHGDVDNKVQGLSERVAAESARRQVLHTGRARQLEAQRAEVARLDEIARFRRKQLAALEVHAGIHGVVEDVPLQNGQWVAIGTVLAKVAEPDHLKAEVKVAEGNARELHKGLSVTFEAPSGAFHGHVERVDPSVVGGTIRVDVELDDAPPPGARADQSVTGYVEIDRIPDALHVERPSGAQDVSTAGVFRLDPDGARATRVTARFGRGSARDIEVAGGLVAGDVVVVSDTSAWDGAESVRIK